MQSLFEHIGQQLDVSFSSIKALYGGSINEVFKLEGEGKNFVLKVNKSSAFPKMFEKEVVGLNLLRSTKTFAVPEVIKTGEFEDFSFLVMDFVQEGDVTATFWEDFARQLAGLHQFSSSQFGATEDNYIGSLLQFNKNEDNAADFYIRQRLTPQFQLAKENGFQFEELNLFFDRIRTIIPDEPPALIHGDLWSGNYLVGENNTAYLIDPAVSYGIREMDLAMMKLFGGFPASIFEEYNRLFPLKLGFENRIELWQLYYLLVHLNLFGQSYLSSVQRIIQKYSSI